MCLLLYIYIYILSVVYVLRLYFQYPIHSLVVFDSENKAIPVAWIIAPRVSSGDAYRWMRALCNRVHAKDPLWRVAGFIVDDPFADITTIRLVASKTFSKKAHVEVYHTIAFSYEDNYCTKPNINSGTLFRQIDSYNNRS